MNPRTWLLTHAWPKLAMNVLGLHNIDNVVIVMLLQNVQYEIDMQPALVSLQSRLYPKYVTHRSINWAIYNSGMTKGISLISAQRELQVTKFY